ncbi:MAG TPA: LysR family transcriptional regulator [Alphaproteobacteria bacterium]
MDRLKAMETYVRVVKEGSFAAAAGQMGVSRAIVTKHVMQLETQIGARLINRSTRRFSVTEIGREYYGFCLRLLEQVSEQDAMIGRLQEEPRGALKILAPKSFGSLYLGGILSEFTALYPGIRVSLVLNDVSMRSLDLIENGFDLAIRLTAHADSSLMAKRVGALRWLPCASPDYLSRHAAPRLPDELVRHNCLMHTKHADGLWRFDGPQGPLAVKVDGSVSANSVIVLRQMTLDGQGVALLPTYCIGPDLAAGRLRRLLPSYSGPDESIYVMFPHRELLPVKIRLFIDFVAERIGAAPWDVTQETSPPAKTRSSATVTPLAGRRRKTTR